MFPKLSRKELVKTICENLDWVTPTGQYKIDSGTQLLNKLEAQGLVQLPTKRWDQSRDTRDRVKIGPQTEACLPIEGNVTDLEPIDLEPVRSRERTRLSPPGLFVPD